MQSQGRPAKEDPASREFQVGEKVKYATDLGVVSGTVFAKVPKGKKPSEVVCELREKGVAAPFPAGHHNMQPRGVDSWLVAVAKRAADEQEYPFKLVWPKSRALELVPELVPAEPEAPKAEPVADEPVAPPADTTEGSAEPEAPKIKKRKKDAGE